MKIIIIGVIPYSILSIILSNLNRQIRMIEKKMDEIVPDEYAEGKRHYYGSYLAELRSRRNMFMKEIYRRADWIEFEMVKKDIRLKDLSTES